MAGSVEVGAASLAVGSRISTDLATCRPHGLRHSATSGCAFALVGVGRAEPLRKMRHDEVGVSGCSRRRVSRGWGHDSARRGGFNGAAWASDHSAAHPQQRSFYSLSVIPCPRRVKPNSARYQRAHVTGRQPIGPKQGRPWGVRGCPTAATATRRTIPPPPRREAAGHQDLRQDPGQDDRSSLPMATPPAATTAADLPPGQRGLRSAGGMSR